MIENKLNYLRSEREKIVHHRTKLDEELSKISIVSRYTDYAEEFQKKLEKQKRFMKEKQMRNNQIRSFLQNSKVEMSTGFDFENSKRIFYENFKKEKSRLIFDRKQQKLGSIQKEINDVKKKIEIEDFKYREESKMSSMIADRQRELDNARKLQIRMREERRIQEEKERIRIEEQDKMRLEEEARIQSQFEMKEFAEKEKKRLEEEYREKMRIEKEEMELKRKLKEEVLKEIMEESVSGGSGGVDSITVDTVRERNISGGAGAERSFVEERLLYAGKVGSERSTVEERKVSAGVKRSFVDDKVEKKIREEKIKEELEREIEERVKREISEENKRKIIKQEIMENNRRLEHQRIENEMIDHPNEKDVIQDELVLVEDDLSVHGIFAGTVDGKDVHFSFRKDSVSYDGKVVQYYRLLNVSLLKKEGSGVRFQVIVMKDKKTKEIWAVENRSEVFQEVLLRQCRVGEKKLLKEPFKDRVAYEVEEDEGEFEEEGEEDSMKKRKIEDDSPTKSGNVQSVIEDEYVFKEESPKTLSEQGPHGDELDLSEYLEMENNKEEIEENKQSFLEEDGKKRRRKKRGTGEGGERRRRKKKKRRRIPSEVPTDEIDGELEGEGSGRSSRGRRKKKRRPSGEDSGRRRRKKKRRPGEESGRRRRRKRRSPQEMEDVDEGREEEHGHVQRKIEEDDEFPVNEYNTLSVDQVKEIEDKKKQERNNESPPKNETKRVNVPNLDLEKVSKQKKKRSPKKNEMERSSPKKVDSHRSGRSSHRKKGEKKGKKGIRGLFKKKKQKSFSENPGDLEDFKNQVDRLEIRGYFTSLKVLLKNIESLITTSQKKKFKLRGKLSNSNIIASYLNTPKSKIRESSNLLYDISMSKSISNYHFTDKVELYRRLLSENSFSLVTNQLLYKLQQVTNPRQVILDKLVFGVAHLVWTLILKHLKFLKKQKLKKLSQIASEISFRLISEDTEDVEIIREQLSSYIMHRLNIKDTDDDEDVLDAGIGNDELPDDRSHTESFESPRLENMSMSSKSIENPVIDIGEKEFRKKGRGSLIVGKSPNKGGYQPSMGKGETTISDDIEDDNIMGSYTPSEQAVIASVGDSEVSLENDDLSHLLGEITGGGGFFSTFPDDKDEDDRMNDVFGF